MSCKHKKIIIEPISETHETVKCAQCGASKRRAKDQAEAAKSNGGSLPAKGGG